MWTLLGSLNVPVDQTVEYGGNNGKFIGSHGMHRAVMCHFSTMQIDLDKSIQHKKKETLI